MKRYKSLQESVLEQQIQKIIDNYCKENNMPSIIIKYTNKQFRQGEAYYQTQKIKGGSINTPVNITIGSWDSIKNFVDEWSFALAHELAHHELNITQNSLSHSKKHETLTYKINDYILRNSKKDKGDKKNIIDKLQYWVDNKEELIKMHGKDTYEKEIKIMQNKLK